MKNKKYYPFERNNYFYGKLLTVRDFEDEQRYMNDKRRINNALTKGAGIVCGLKTILLDDKTISVESGMALDYQGREIIVEESFSKKLNVIDGYDSIQNTDAVYLCLSYDEEREQLLHSVVGNAEDGEADFGRVMESYRISLTDTVNENAVLASDRLFTSNTIVYHDNGIKITQGLPVTVKAGQAFDIQVLIEKENLPRAFEVDYTMTLDCFTTEEGENKLHVFCRDEDFIPYKKVELKYTLIAPDSEELSSEFYIEPTICRIGIGTQIFSPAEAVKTSINVVTGRVWEKICSSYFEKHFDNVLSLNAENSIYIAKMRIIKRMADYSILDFQWLPFKQYVLSNNMLATLIEKSIEARNMSFEKSTEPPLPAVPVALPVEKKDASGTEIIYIDTHSKNKTYFSEEISHGLGKGDVFIEIAVEDIARQEDIFGESKTIFGDVSILNDTIFEADIPKISTAVISFTQKGTFRIGMKVFEDSYITTIPLKWRVSKTDETRQEDPSAMNNVLISILPDTVQIQPKEKVKFTAEIRGTNSRECHWYIRDENGGEIDTNGIYEAPSQEGVFEIAVESVRYPNKKATAYVVVKKR